MNGNGLKLDLKLNLSPPRVSHPMVVSPANRSSTVSPSSSCVSSENQDDGGRRFCSSPDAAAAATSMVLVGCPRCLMYVMLAEGEPKCPKCKSTVLLNVFYDHHGNNARRA